MEKKEVETRAGAAGSSIHPIGICILLPLFQQAMQYFQPALFSTYFKTGLRVLDP